MTPQLLAAEMADAQQAALAAADQRFRDVHGDDDSQWSDAEWDTYDRRMDSIGRVFAAELEAVAL